MHLATYRCHSRSRLPIPQPLCAMCATPACSLMPVKLRALWGTDVYTGDSDLVRPIYGCPRPVCTAVRPFAPHLHAAVPDAIACKPIRPCMIVLSMVGRHPRAHGPHSPQAGAAAQRTARHGMRSHAYVCARMRTRAPGVMRRRTARARACSSQLVTGRAADAVRRWPRGRTRWLSGEGCAAASPSPSPILPPPIAHLPSPYLPHLTPVSLVPLPS